MYNVTNVDVDKQCVRECLSQPSQVLKVLKQSY